MGFLFLVEMAQTHYYKLRETERFNYHYPVNGASRADIISKIEKGDVSWDWFPGLATVSDGDKHLVFFWKIKADFFILTYKETFS